MPGIGALGAWRRTVRGDTVAGLAVAAYLVPQCMAYARLAGVPPITGLWAALGALVLYALLGTSSRLSVGPDSASALLVGSAVATIGADVGPQNRAQIAAALALAVGAIALLAWATRLGFIADLLSRPVLVGYMNGVAVTMIVSQLPNLTGISSERRDMPALAVDIALRLGDLQPAPLVGAAVVTALTLLQRIRRVPGPLIVVLGATAVTAIFDLEDHGVTTIGRVPNGLPPLTLPGIPTHLWPSVLAAAAGICVVVFTDNILSARAFATRRGDRIDANQELLALAGANTAGGLAGLHDIDDYPEAVTLPGLVVYRYDAPLCFANSEDFRRRVTKAVNEADAPVEWVVLNMEANVEIDLTATDMLEALRSELASRGIQLVLGRVKHDLAVYLERAGFTSRVGADHMFPTLPTALEGFLRRHGAAPQG